MASAIQATGVRKSFLAKALAHRAKVSERGHRHLRGGSSSEVGVETAKRQNVKFLDLVQANGRNSGAAEGCPECI